ncbi:MAG: hypothetical protein WCT41_01200 [Candidatus Paceibacterota bacterium]|jgi:hypothetical protein
MATREAASGRIQILKTPAWDAPLEARGAFVMKAALPCYPYVGYPSGVVRDVVTRREMEIKKIGVIVPQDKALQVLWQNNPVAATWWIDRGFPKRRGCFFFTEGEFTIVSGVPDDPVWVFENIRVGHWRQMLP